MTTWEYLTTPLLIHNTAAILNNWGKQGWEPVSYTHLTLPTTPYV